MEQLENVDIAEQEQEQERIKQSKRTDDLHLLHIKFCFKVFTFCIGWTVFLGMLLLLSGFGRSFDFFQISDTILIVFSGSS